VEVLIVTLIIDQMLESREKQRRMEKLNMLVGAFFSTAGTPLLAVLAQADPDADSLAGSLVVTGDWKEEQFGAVRSCLSTHPCNVRIERVDLPALRAFLLGREDFLIRLVENPMVFEHESFTALILAVSHLTEEIKARSDVTALPTPDLQHLEADLRRVYSALVHEWVRYMAYLRAHYPYLFSLAMRTNPFDPSASVIVRQS
jgi:hypothetical protein